MDNSMLDSMDGMRDVVAALAGVKTMLIEAGFSEGVAELMVLEILRKGVSSE